MPCICHRYERYAIYMSQFRDRLIATYVWRMRSMSSMTYILHAFINMYGVGRMHSVTELPRTYVLHAPRRMRSMNYVSRRTSYNVRHTCGVPFVS